MQHQPIPLNEATRRRLEILIARDHKRRLAGTHAEWWSVVKPGIEYRIACDLLERCNNPGT